MKNKKIIFSVVIILLFLFVIFPLFIGMILGPEILDVSTDTNIITTDEIKSEPTSNIISENISETTSEIITEKVYTKEDFIELDKNIIELKKQADEYIVSIATIGVTLENSNPSVGELSNYQSQLKDLKKGLNDITLNSSKIQNKYSDEYILNLQLIVSIGRNMADNLIKYIDKKEIKYITNANSEANKLSNYFKQFENERNNFFLNNGFSQDEIPSM
jgi:hypothetical protein|nr:MAG TPA: hypothetical protein [Caudoviricetes sp.]